MKTLRQYREAYQINISPQEQASFIWYLKKENIDFDVYLPSYGINLQRSDVWSIEQRRELIDSIFIGRHIPHISLLYKVDPCNTKESIIQVIDGRQRLKAIFDFMDDNFTVSVEGGEYLYSELLQDYQIAIYKQYIRCYVVNEPLEEPLTDDDKLAWFRLINYAGTPQEKDHLRKFVKLQ